MNFWPRLNFVFFFVSFATCWRWKVAISSQIEFLEFFSPFLFSLHHHNVSTPRVKRSPTVCFAFFWLLFIRSMSGDFGMTKTTSQSTRHLNVNFSWPQIHSRIELKLVEKAGKLRMKIVSHGEWQSLLCWLWKLIEFSSVFSQRWTFCAVANKVSRNMQLFVYLAAIQENPSNCSNGMEWNIVQQ